MTPTSKKSYGALFVLSLSSFLYEIFLIRVFSVLFPSEYLFLLISLAVLGLGVGAIVCCQLRDNRRWNTIFRRVVWVYPLVFFFAYLLIFELFPFMGMAGSVVVGLIPFVLSGFLLSFLYASFPEKSGILCFTDLVGGAVGCLLSVLSAHVLGVSLSLPLIGIIASLVVLLLSDLPILSRGIPMILSVVFFLLSLLSNPFALDGESLKNTDTPLGQTLSYPRIKAQWIKSTWDLYSRCDLMLSSSDGMRKGVFINGGTQAEMIRNTTDPEILKYLKKDIIYLPYLFGTNDKVLILGSGGGRDVFMALAAGAGHVDAVEINRGVINLVQEEKSFTGDIYGRDNVRLVVEDGRSFLMKSEDVYDRIVLSLTSTLAFSDLSALGQQENYLYTQEAFQIYFDHLRPGGSLTIFIDYSELLEKFILSALSVFKDMGIGTQAGMRHIAAFTTKQWSGYRYGIIIKKSPFDLATADRLAEKIREFTLKPIFLPFYESNTDFYRLASGAMTPKQYTSNSPSNLKPSTDDNPFFLEVVLKLRNQLIFLAVVVGGIIIAAALGFYMSILKKIASGTHIDIPAIRDKYERSRFYMLVFILTGCGFFMVEIALTKRFSFYLGLPHLNLAVVLSSILLGTALGGGVTSRFREKLEQKLIAVSLILIAVILVVWISLAGFIDSTIHWPLPGRCAILALYLLPLSFFLGMPFPITIRWSRKLFAEEMAWFWGMNAMAGVLGSILSVVLAMVWGFTATFIGAAFVYLAVAITVRLSVKYSEIS